jgi:hypothetical protein
MRAIEQIKTGIVIEYIHKNLQLGNRKKNPVIQIPPRAHPIFSSANPDVLKFPT